MGQAFAAGVAQLFASGAAAFVGGLFKAILIDARLDRLRCALNSRR